MRSHTANQLAPSDSQVAPLSSLASGKERSEPFETVVSFLKSLSDHVMSDVPRETDLLRDKASAWVRHISIGAPHPDNRHTIDRDFAGARRFVAHTLRDGHAVQMRTLNEFRDATWGLTSELHAIVTAERGEDAQLTQQANELRAAIQHGGVEALVTAANKLSRDLLQIVAARSGRNQAATLRAAERLPTVLDLMQRSSDLTYDPATGLLDQRALTQVAEQVHIMSGLANTPASVALLSLQDTGLLGSELDALMASLTPVLSRSFLSRNDVLGRHSANSFAVIGAGRDVLGAQQAGERAKAALEGAVEAATAGKKRLSINLGVAPLASPVSDAFASARRP